MLELCHHGGAKGACGVKKKIERRKPNIHWHQKDTEDHFQVSYLNCFFLPKEADINTKDS